MQYWAVDYPGEEEEEDQAQGHVDGCCEWWEWTERWQTHCVYVVSCVYVVCDMVVCERDACGVYNIVWCECVYECARVRCVCVMYVVHVRAYVRVVRVD